ncbi:MAG: DUF2207 domain-containing protein [Thermodesulfobacteriota bacterium]|nr:DUF2207 domain-containing protein [Thermodesulfobacteriota bacterium]
MKKLNLYFSAIFIFSIISICFSQIAVAYETERIINFTSHIQLSLDGSMTVTENITVYASGNSIKRGIYRDFPTRYKDRRGNTIRVGFNVLQVLRDGQSEGYHLKTISNGIRVYIGRKNRMLQPGKYTYTLTYSTNRQLGFFKEFDELYWNVTGNGWSFPIERAEAVVELPFDAEVMDYAGYTGPQGARGRNFIADKDESGNIRFVTDRLLRPREGLTIAVSWPKGYIAEPTLSDEMGYVLSDHPGSKAALIGVTALLIYFLIAWIRVGRDPASGAIIPRFGPPKGFTPAAVRFVSRMNFDHKAFAAAIVNMAVKGYLTIDEDEGDYSLSRTDLAGSVLSAGEKRLAKKLFKGSNSIALDKSNHSKIKQAIVAIKNSLKLDFEKIHFQRNSKWLIPGAVISLLTLVAMVFTAGEISGAVFMLIWLSIWTAACFALVVAAIKAWQRALTSGSSTGIFKKSGAIGISLFALPFLGAECFGMWAFSTMTSPFAVMALLVVIFFNFIFYHLIKAPTLYGRKIMDQIEGFKLYLSVAEKESLNMRNPPEKTPELFEKFLPFALALDVENAWSEQFAEVLVQAQTERGYSPAWYSGRPWHTHGATGLASSLGSAFSSTISSSSSPPGSSSGSGGGGSSGGGGGGGGGGGW